MKKGVKVLDNLHEDYTTEPSIAQQQFSIDPEFENKIPPIGDDEFKQLRENILAAGEVYEPLVVWNGTLVDGHNRWKVIQENHNIKWRVRTMDFPDKWAAFEWMYKNQLGRRNLTDEQRTYTIGKMKEARKQSVGAPAENKNAQKQMHQNGVIVSDGHKHGTASAIAFELGIGRNTVDRAEKFAKGVDALREVSPVAADKVLSGKANVTKQDVAEIGKMSPIDIADVADAIVKGQSTKKKSIGFPKADRELKSIIDNSIAVITGEIDAPAFNVDNLIDMVRMDGENYIQNLRSTLSNRTDMLKDADAKQRVSVVISEIMKKIVEVRGEYLR